MKYIVCISFCNNVKWRYLNIFINIDCIQFKKVKTIINQIYPNRLMTSRKREYNFVYIMSAFIVTDK